MALPALREELDLFEGPRLANGQPSWVLHDPVRQQFFRIDWLTFEILSRWGLGDTRTIIANIERDTPLEVSPEDLEATFKFLSEQQLLRVEGGEAIRKMAERKQSGKSQWWQWLIHHYLFFRVPLLRPDAWLGRMGGFAELFFLAAFCGSAWGRSCWGRTRSRGSGMHFTPSCSTPCHSRVWPPTAWRCF